MARRVLGYGGIANTRARVFTGKQLFVDVATAPQNSQKATWRMRKKSRRSGGNRL